MTPTVNHLVHQFDTRIQAHPSHWHSPASIYAMIASHNIQAYGKESHLEDRVQTLCEAIQGCNLDEWSSLEQSIAKCERLVNSLPFMEKIPRLTDYGPLFMIRSDGNQTFRIQLLGHFPSNMQATLMMGKEHVPVDKTESTLDFVIPQRNGAYNFDHPGLIFMFGKVILKEPNSSSPSIEYPIRIGAFTPSCGWVHIFYKTQDGNNPHVDHPPVKHLLMWGQGWVWKYPGNLVGYVPYKVWFKSSLDWSETVFVHNGRDRQSNRYLSMLFHSQLVSFEPITLA